MINRSLRLLIAAGALIALAALSSGCGGSSSETTDSAGTTADNASGEGSAAFIKAGSSTNGLVEFGREGPASEREAASAVLAENLKAREEGDFATQCATLAQPAVEEVANGRKGAAADKACPAALRTLAMPLNSTQAVRANTLDGEIAALRVEGNQGQALYHGNDGKDYAMPMRKESVSWKVGALLATELNPPQEGASGTQQSPPGN